MTLPAPSDAAIEAAANALELWHADPAWRRAVAEYVLPRALPLLRAQWAAEVQVALRDRERWLAWFPTRPRRQDPGVNDIAADYLADTLGAKPEETDQ